jgi:hypothetical protein
MQFDFPASAKEIPFGNPERKRITDLPGGPGNHHVHGGTAAHRPSEAKCGKLQNIEIIRLIERCAVFVVSCIEFCDQTVDLDKQTGVLNIKEKNDSESGLY